MISRTGTRTASSLWLVHVFVVAAWFTAGFMLTTAAELGPMGPLVIAEALYLAAFALVVELGLGAHAVSRALSGFLERRRAPQLAQDA